MSDWNLVVAFPDGSPSFVAGFEAGMLWSRMKTGTEAEIEMTTRVENREVIDRMAVAEGWRIERATTEADGWDTTTLVKVAPARANPHGLKVVS